MEKQVLSFHERQSFFFTRPENPFVKKKKKKKTCDKYCKVLAIKSIIYGLIGPSISSLIETSPPSIREDNSFSLIGFIYQLPLRHQLE